MFGSARLSAAVVGVVLITGGCTSQRATAIRATPSATTTSITTRATTTSTAVTALPDVVDGVPLHRLADRARGLAAVWSEKHPWNIRAAVGSEYQANTLGDSGGATYHFGDKTNAEYVVALDGRFWCGPPLCSGSQPPPPPGQTFPPPIAPNPIPVSTMLFTEPITPNTGSSSLAVMSHDADMALLGKVYQLDQYP
jgi:hypothetical protein